MKLLLKEDIFSVEDRPTKSCHASTLLDVQGGILAAWFGGSAEGRDDVGILYARRILDKWTKPVMLPRTHNEPHWNPVLFRMPDGKIWLFYKVGKPISAWRTYYRISLDEGATFGEERELVEGNVGGRGPVKNKPILLSNGTVLAPASWEPSSFEHRKEKNWVCFTDSTVDSGKNWTQSEFIAKPEGVSVIQPTLWESEPGKVHMLVRSDGGFIYRSDSQDYGKTWCELYPTSLPNNNSGIDCVKGPDGVLALVYNPISGSSWQSARTPIQIVFSYDNGMSWREPVVLQSGPGEFSYPSVIFADNRFCISFTGNRTTICYCEVM